MADEFRSGVYAAGPEPDQKTLREWARKTYLRRNMRSEALSPDQLWMLDERLARWTADQQLAGKLPPDWELRSRFPALAREFRGGRDKAEPIFTADELLEVDASRGAASVRNSIDGKGDFAPALRKKAIQYGVSAGMTELEARKKIADRFEKMFGRSITEYAREQKGQSPESAAPEKRDRLFPPELKWDRYEPAFRRLAAYDAKMHVERVNGEITEKEYQQGRKYRNAWEADQRRRGRLPSFAEMGLSGTPVEQMLLPHKKKLGQQERQVAHGPDSAYWRQVDELAGYVKEDIETERRYTRSMEDYALNHAGRYGRQVQQMKRDIEERFTLNYLYTPGEYLEKQLHAEKSHQPPREAGTSRDHENDGDMEM